MTREEFLNTPHGTLLALPDGEPWVFLEAAPCEWRRLEYSLDIELRVWSPFVGYHCLMLNTCIAHPFWELEPYTVRYGS